MTLRCTVALLAGSMMIVISAPVVVGAQTSASGTIRDSAGVQVVSHRREAAVRQFEARPTEIELGATAGTELVRVVGAIRVPNGKFLVADAGRRHLLRFGARGDFERVLGRDGAGPGEFAQIRWMGRHGSDSIATYDGRQFRYSVFTDSGFVRQAIVQKSEHMYLAETSVFGLLSRGAPVATAGGAIQLGDLGPARIERAEFPVVRYEVDGKPGRLLARYPGDEIQVSVLESGPMSGGFARRLRLFGTTSTVGLVSNHVVVVDNARFQFDVVDTLGRLVRRVRVEHDRSPVEARHMDAYAVERASAVVNTSQRDSLRRSYAREPHAAEFPAVDSRVMLDAERRIWLGSYRRPGDREQTWWIFTLSGALVGRVMVPASLTLMDAGTDYLLGVWRDSDGVQTVRQFNLVPASGR